MTAGFHGPQQLSMTKELLFVKRTRVSVAFSIKLAFRRAITRNRGRPRHKHRQLAHASSERCPIHHCCHTYFSTFVYCTCPLPCTLSTQSQLSIPGRLSQSATLSSGASRTATRRRLVNPGAAAVRASTASNKHNAAHQHYRCRRHSHSKHKHTRSTLAIKQTKRT
jgi:hypothetical protein